MVILQGLVDLLAAQPQKRNENGQSSIRKVWECLRGSTYNGRLLDYKYLIIGCVIRTLPPGGA